jgi:hypothetical protein
MSIATPAPISRYIVSRLPVSYHFAAHVRPDHSCQGSPENQLGEDEFGVGALRQGFPKDVYAVDIPYRQIGLKPRCDLAKLSFRPKNFGAAHRGDPEKVSQAGFRSCAG